MRPFYEVHYVRIPAAKRRFFAELPVMPLREVVMLPRTIMPLFVGREASIKAIELAQSGYNKQMFLVAPARARCGEARRR